MRGLSRVKLVKDLGYRDLHLISATWHRKLSGSQRGLNPPEEGSSSSHRCWVST